MKLNALRSLALAAAFAVAIVAAIAPGAASAQQYGYGNHGYYNRTESVVTGSVRYFSGYDLRLDGRRSVRLHPGTIINPTGITLRRGMDVRVFGHPNRDGSFEANRIEVQRRRYR